MTTTQEKQMLRTAKKLRRLVYADYMTKTANPAIAMLAKSFVPALKQLGPKVLGMLKNIPPETWAQIIPHLISGLVPKAPATASVKSASGKPWEDDEDEDEKKDKDEEKDDDKAKDDDKDEEGGGTRINTAVQAMTKALRKGKVKHPETVARVLYLAAVETGTKHRKEANPTVTKALRMVNRMRTELKIIREFV